MEIKECRSHEFMFEAIKHKLECIKLKVETDYTNDLIIYKHECGSCWYLAQNIPGETKLFGIVVHKYKTPKNLVEVSLNDGILKVFIIESFISYIVKKELTNFAEEYKENIKRVNFIKNF